MSEYKDLYHTILDMKKPKLVSEGEVYSFNTGKVKSNDLFHNQREHAKGLLREAGYRQTSENEFLHPAGHKAEFKHTEPHPFVVHFSAKEPHGHALTIEHPFMTTHAINAMKDFED